jgi:hypothetical protein
MKDVNDRLWIVLAGRAAGVPRRTLRRFVHGKPLRGGPNAGPRVGGGTPVPPHVPKSPQGNAEGSPSGPDAAD